MAAITYEKDSFILTLKDKDWQFQETDSIFMLSKSHRLRSSQLQIQAIEPTAIAFFTVDTHLLTLPLENQQVLKPFGSPQLLRGASPFYWVEMRDGENIVVDDNGNAYHFYIGFIFSEAQKKSFYIVGNIIYNLFLADKIKTFEEELLQVIRDFRFKIVPPPLNSFKNSMEIAVQKFAQTKLQFIDSYSSGYHAGGGGYSTDEQIWLYVNGTFRYHYESVTSAPSFNGMSLGSGYKTDKGIGKWHIWGEKLYLQFSDGRTMGWTFQFTSGMVYLDGRKFYWTKL